MFVIVEDVTIKIRFHLIYFVKKWVIKLNRIQASNEFEPKMTSYNIPDMTSYDNLE